MSDVIDFLEKKFGKPKNASPFSEILVEKYKELLSKDIFEIWRAYGSAPFGNGLFNFVNPDECNDIIMPWLELIPQVQPSGCFLLLKSAFGKLYIYDCNSLSYYVVNCIDARYSHFKPKKNYTKELVLKVLIIAANENSLEEFDENGDALFKRALKEIGPLSSNEIYGFEPRLCLGGPARLQNLSKFRWDVHLDIIRNSTHELKEFKI